jgi:hypothetical protein
MKNNKNINNKKDGIAADSIWVVSDGGTVNQDLSSLCGEAILGSVKEYLISDIAYYLLNPNPITLEEKVVGCRVKYSKPRSGIIRRFFKKIRLMKDDAAETGPLEEDEIVSNSKIGAPSFEDEKLNKHLLKIIAQLRPFDPLQKRLSSLDSDKISNVTAICEEIGGNRYPLNLKGTVEEKIHFVAKSISKKAKVVFNKAYLLNGLFEMRGYRCESFESDRHYKLIRFEGTNSSRYCVLNHNYKFEYWVNDIHLINYMHILGQALKSDPKLREALMLCINGNAKPLKLFFSKQLDQKYSDVYLPMTYRQVFNTLNIGQPERETVTNILNNNQIIVFFSYAPPTEVSNRKMCTNISVMHDVKALEPIKDQLPQVYAEISKKTSVSDAGRLYLLDSIREFQNA